MCWRNVDFANFSAGIVSPPRFARATLSQSGHVKSRKIFGLCLVGTVSPSRGELAGAADVDGVKEGDEEGFGAPITWDQCRAVARRLQFVASQRSEAI